MKKIYSYLKTYWHEEVKMPYLIVLMLFLATCIFIEYNYQLLTQLLQPQRKSINYFYSNLILYSIPLLFSIFLYIKFYNRNDLLKNRKFWLLIIFIIIAYAFRAYVYQHRDLVIYLNNGIYDKFLIKCTNQFTQALLVFTPAFLFWYLSGHYKKENFYGFRLKGVDLKPYYTMLLLMLPLVTIASFQSDFLHSYPSYKGIINDTNPDYSTWIKIMTFESLYGGDYVMTELFFRGFILFNLARFMGKGSILPMAAMYVFIHFGKPAGETISSFFGGTILGIIAYETRSIYGGIIVHCGIAYMMEIGGTVGNMFKN